MQRVTEAELEDSTLLQDNVKVRDFDAMPPLFSRLSERKAPGLDYVGVSYGLTGQLHKFWKRSQFVPVYLRQTPNDLTGEHTCVMIRALETSNEDSSWVGSFARDFHRRFLSLLSYQFRTFESVMALSIDESASAGSKLEVSSAPQPLTKLELDKLFSPFDLKRLDSYANNMLDYHVILDMLPTIAFLYFTGRLKPVVKLSGVQTALLVAIGLQRKGFEDVEKELKLNNSQLLAMFVKVVRKVSTHFRSLLEGAVAETLPEAMEMDDETGVHGENGVQSADVQRFKPLTKKLEDELAEGGEEIDQAERERVRSMIDALPLDQ
jgi:N-acetyltransferase 10